MQEREQAVPACHPSMQKRLASFDRVDQPDLEPLRPDPLVQRLRREQKLNDKAENYLVQELHREVCELDRQDRYLDTKLNRFNAYNMRILQELYWTFTRAMHFDIFDDWPVPSGVGAPHSNAGASERPLLDGAVPEAKRSSRILIDVTPTQRWGGQRGIQRVVRELAKAAARSGGGLPVFIINGQLRSYFRHPALPDEVEIAEGDTFLMPDSSQSFSDEYLPIMEAVSAKNGSNVIVLHDIIPLQYPAAVAPPAAEVFEPWMRKVVFASDAVVAVSRSAAEDFFNYAKTKHVRFHPGFRIGWWGLGADFAPAATDSASQIAKSLCADGAPPFFLSVGTLEPHKGYRVALAAFNKLWSAGVDVRYVIVGRPGWRWRAQETMIRESPEFGRRLFWLADADDADLSLLYRHARRLVAASCAEGFGLPIVEAAHFGLPAIASDIPVFREIGNSATRYFELLDSEALAAAVREALTAPKPEISCPPRSWREATRDLLELVTNRSYQLAPEKAADGGECARLGDRS